MPLAASKRNSFSSFLTVKHQVATDLMPLAASKHHDTISAIVYAMVATDLMPLAASKLKSNSILDFVGISCNRPNAACGIETMGAVTAVAVGRGCNRPNAACGIETM